MLVEIKLSLWTGGRRSYSSPDMVLASLNIRRVESVRGLDSQAGLFSFRQIIGKGHFNYIIFMG
jgi:hypothetical protein